jgi:hypothetical protein
MLTGENSRCAAFGLAAPSYEDQRRERLQDSIDEYLEDFEPSDPGKNLRILLADIDAVLRSRRDHYGAMTELCNDSLQAFAHAANLPFVKDHA